MKFVIEREKILPFWNQLRDSYFKQNKDEAPAKPGDFEAHVWSNFDPIKNAELLLNPAPSFKGHKELAFCAWCTWVVLPCKSSGSLHDGFIKSAITRAAANIMLRAEREAMDFPWDMKALSDFLARLYTSGCYL